MGPVGLAAVPGGAAALEAPPLGALLGDRHRQTGSGPSGQHRGGDLREQVVRPYRVPFVVDQPAGSESAGGLLVGDSQEEQVSCGGGRLAGEEPFEDDGHRRGHVEHVDRTPAPDEAISPLTRERVDRPSRGSHRDDIGVSHQHEAGGVGVGSRNPVEHRAPAGVRLEVLAGLAQVALEGGDGAILAAGVGGAVVDAGVPDERPEQFADFARPDLIPHQILHRPAALPSTS